MNDDTLREKLERLFNEPIDDTSSPRTDAAMQLIAARDEQRERELLDKIRTIVVKRGAPDNYYGEVWEWIEDGLTKTNQQTGEK